VWTFVLWWGRAAVVQRARSEGMDLQARDPRSGQDRSGARAGASKRQAGAATGRPAFGLGPIARVTPSPLAGQTATDDRYAVAPLTRPGFGLPNLRRNVCPHFYLTGSRGAIPIQAPHLLKALIRQDTNIARCQLRGGVHLDQGYVNDVCLTPRFNQCVFYEDELTRE
jgi:hypothetical protein